MLAEKLVVLLVGQALLEPELLGDHALQVPCGHGDAHDARSPLLADGDQRGVDGQVCRQTIVGGVPVVPMLGGESMLAGVVLEQKVHRFVSDDEGERLGPAAVLQDILDERRMHQTLAVSGHVRGWDLDHAAVRLGDLPHHTDVDGVSHRDDERLQVRHGRAGGGTGHEVCLLQRSIVVLVRLPVVHIELLLFLNTRS